MAAVQLIVQPNQPKKTAGKVAVEGVAAAGKMAAVAAAVAADEGADEGVDGGAAEAAGGAAGKKRQIGSARPAERPVRGWCVLSSSDLRSSMLLMVYSRHATLLHRRTKMLHLVPLQPQPAQARITRPASRTLTRAPSLSAPLLSSLRPP